MQRDARDCREQMEKEFAFTVALFFVYLEKCKRENFNILPQLSLFYADLTGIIVYLSKNELTEIGLTF